LVTAGTNVPADLDKPFLKGALQDRFLKGYNFGLTDFIIPTYPFEEGGHYDVQVIGNAALMEFTLSPAGVSWWAETAKMSVDVTRTVEARVWYTDANGTMLAESVDFPAWLDVANDDKNANDEDDLPRNDHIYSVDTPAILQKQPTEGLNAVSPPFDRAQHRMNAYEFVRVLLNGEEFEEQGSTAMAQGSRASLLQPWHSRIDVVWGVADPFRYVRNNVAGENEINPNHKALGQP